MDARRLVLASGSETRLHVLRSAGFDPEVAPSDVPEDVPPDMPVRVAAAMLAERKATAVAPRFPDAIVLACDTIIDLDGTALGKPASRSEAASWWRSMRGRQVTVWTGHALVVGERRAARTTSASLLFSGDVTDGEIDRYCARDDWDGAAGGFRLNGLAGPFIDTVTGNPGTISGVSLPALRDMLRELGLELTDLWTDSSCR
jgi:septum formation protein